MGPLWDGTLLIKIIQVFDCWGLHHLERAGGSEVQPGDLYMGFSISLVRTSPIPPPPMQGIWQRRGGRWNAGWVPLSHQSRDDFSGQPWFWWFRTLHSEGDPASWRRNEGPDWIPWKHQKLSKNLQRMIHIHLFLLLINTYVKPVVLWERDFQLNKSPRQSLLWTSFTLERCSTLLWICFSKQ